MGLSPLDSESSAYTCSATRAYWHPREDSNPELLIRSQA